MTRHNNRNNGTAGRRLGHRLKDAALAQHEAHRADLLLLARRRMLEVLIEHGAATMDDVTPAIAARIPAGRDPRFLGATAHALVAAGLICFERYQTSTRPEAHARPLKVWALVDRAGALAWLATHPDPGDPPAGGAVGPVDRPPDPRPAPPRKGPAGEGGAEAAGGGGEADEDRTAADAPAPVGPGLFDFDGAKGVARGA